MKKSLLALTSLLAGSQVEAATWQFQWTPAAGENTPTVEVTPFKYGKSWAYGVEIDDGGIGALTVSQPLLARYQWNVAPPGVAGGANKPFVGTAAVVVGSIGRNSASMNFEQIAELKKLGWSIVNHSYWHSGVHWDKTKMNTPEQFRRELFWSQSVLAEFIGGGRAPTHFVFPNGDYNYGPYLHEFGLLSGSRTSGSSPRNLFDPKLNLLNFNRNYLDTEPWKAKNNALHGLPEKPQPGDFVIDFTHGMSDDPKSINNKLWVERLNHIVKGWEPQGDNSMWVAPTDEVFDYFHASRGAKTTVTKGTITV
ncbi:MAG: polysaccharide deacetylase family protein, partial [Armatimonadetes bacterium]|nr:polysaccharide deacetylase family protein [Armatimonadota bacterium]